MMNIKWNKNINNLDIIIKIYKLRKLCNEIDIVKFELFNIKSYNASNTS